MCNVTKIKDKLLFKGNSNQLYRGICGYAIKYIDEYKNHMNFGEEIAELFSDMAFLIYKKDILNEDIEKFLQNLSIHFEEGDKFLSIHISNLMEMVLVKRPELISFYNKEVSLHMNKIDMDNTALLYRASALSAVKNELSLEEILSLITYPWRWHFDIATYLLYSGKGLLSVNHIKKAVNTCPECLKREYISRRDYIGRKIIVNTIQE